MGDRTPPRPIRRPDPRFAPQRLTEAEIIARDRERENIIQGFYNRINELDSIIANLEKILGRDGATALPQYIAYKTQLNTAKKELDKYLMQFSRDEVTARQLLELGTARVFRD
jgi:ElaB/YqjD/DUF883 family membrane-anchored ribosome-binding protein